MTFGSEARRSIAGAAAGLFYGFVLSFLSFGAAGAGHGTLIPLLLSSAPLGAFYSAADTDGGRGDALFAMLFGGPLLWMVLGWLVSRAGRGAVAAAGLLALHYASGLAIVAATGDSPRGLAGEIPDFFKIWAPAYLIGQLVLWWQIARRLRRQPTV
jgi:hypothetical protein